MARTLLEQRFAEIRMTYLGEFAEYAESSAVARTGTLNLREDRIALSLGIEPAPPPDCGELVNYLRARR